MARIDTPVNPTGDPSYTGNQFTQGTDRASLQPLASVPQLSTKFYEPDHKVNNTAGKAIEGLGSLFEAGVTATDSAITNQVNDTLQKGLSGIRDSFTTAQAQAISQADPKDVAGGLTLAGADKTTPVAVDKLGNKIQNLQEAYRQGVFDDTAYYGKLEAYVRQVKAQYPGYQDDIDKQVSRITGVTPANALRSAQQSKLDTLNKQTDKTADRQDSYEKQNQAYIQSVWPDYFQRKAQGNAPSFVDVQTKVGNLQAMEWQTKSKSAELAADAAVTDANKNKAYTLATSNLTDLADRIVLGSTNAMGLRSPQDFQRLLDDVRSGKRAALTPDEKAQTAEAFGQLRGQYVTQAETFMASPLAQGSIETLNSKIGDPGKRDAAVALGRKKIDDLEDALVNEKYGLFTHDVNWNKATQDASVGSFMKSSEASQAVYAARTIIGDNGALMLNLYNGPLQSNLMQGFRQFGAASAALGQGSMSQTFDVFKREGQTDPALWQSHIQDSTNMIVHSKELADPNAAKSAVQYLFGPGNRTLIEAYASKPGSQVNLFNNLVSKPMVDAVSKMDPASKKTFIEAANSNFASVYATQAMGANQNAKNWAASSNLKLDFDEKNGTFSYTATNAARGFFTPSATLQKANAGLIPFNSAIKNMNEVFKMQGKTPSEAMYSMLPVVGVEPGSPLYKAVQDKIEAQEAQPK